MWTRNLSLYNRTNLFLWLAMSFQAGMINAGGYLACHRFVSHTTGFATQFGTEFAQGHATTALGSLLVPVFFLSGAMLSAFYIDRRISKGLAPLYTWMIGIISVLLFFVTFAGVNGWFSTFGEPAIMRSDFTLLAILCMACGIQNAAVTSASGAVIRTTHLTGLTTDLGIGLVRIWNPSPKTSRKLEVQATGIRLFLISGFLVGSTVGAFIFLKFSYAGFLGPALTSTSLFLLGIYTASRRKRLQKQSQQVAT